MHAKKLSSFYVCKQYLVYAKNNLAVKSISNRSLTWLSHFQEFKMSPMNVHWKKGKVAPQCLHLSSTDNLAYPVILSSLPPTFSSNGSPLKFTDAEKIQKALRFTKRCAFTNRNNTSTNKTDKSHIHLHTSIFFFPVFGTLAGQVTISPQQNLVI